MFATNMMRILSLKRLIDSSISGRIISSICNLIKGGESVLRPRKRSKSNDQSSGDATMTGNTKRFQMQDPIATLRLGSIHI